MLQEYLNRYLSYFANPFDQVVIMRLLKYNNLQLMCDVLPFDTIHFIKRPQDEENIKLIIENIKTFGKIKLKTFKEGWRI